MHIDDPRFPPLLSGYGVKAPANCFDTACRGAMDGTYGAADVVFARNTRRVEMSLVLEPDVARMRALEMLPLFQLAVIEAVGALMPPKTAVQLRWPATLLVNGGAAGRFRFAGAASAADEVPDWMVVGVEIDLMRDIGGQEPGEVRETSSLEEEGSGERTRSDFLEVIGAYVLSWINSWQDTGQSAFAESWVGRVEGYEAPVPMQLVGGSGERVVAQVLGIDDELRLMVKVAEGDVRALAICALLEDGPQAQSRTATA